MCTLGRIVTCTTPAAPAALGSTLRAALSTRTHGGPACRVCRALEDPPGAMVAGRLAPGSLLRARKPNARLTTIPTLQPPHARRACSPKRCAYLPAPSQEMAALFETASLLQGRKRREVW